MTLVEQCVQGEGLVQINVEIKVAKKNYLADVMISSLVHRLNLGG